MESRKSHWGMIPNRSRILRLPQKVIVEVKIAPKAGQSKKKIKKKRVNE